MSELLNFSIEDYRGELLGLIAGLVLSSLWWGIVRLKIKVQQALARNLWKPFLIYKNKSTWVVLTTKPSGRPSGTPKVSLSEVRGFSEVRRTLSNLGVEGNLKDEPDIHLNKIGAVNIVAIGGPKNNNVTREILAAASHKYKMMPFRYDEPAGELLVNGAALKPLEDLIGELKKDYGVVVRATGLHDSGACCLVAFGMRGHGTWAAVKALTLDRGMMRDIEKKVGISDFALLLEFEFNGNVLVSSKIHSAIKLIA